MLNIFFVRALQKRLPSIIVTAVCPGFCISDLRRHVTGEQAAYYKKLEDELAYTAEEGSRHIIYGAVGGADQEDKLKGAFITTGTIKVPDYVVSEDGQKAEEKLWVRSSLCIHRD